MLRKFHKIYEKKKRTARAALFVKLFNPTENDRILDLGGYDGSYIATIIPFRKNVYIADIDEKALEIAKSKYGFNTTLLNENGKLPFTDHFFDIVFCNAVIQQATVDKKDIRKYKTNKEFSAEAMKYQKAFAGEIKRIGKNYYVQTPNKYFIIESCTWLPVVVVLLPRQLLIKTIDFFNKFWPKKTKADWNLLTEKDVKNLFPEAEIMKEKSLLMNKSFIAIKRLR